MRSLVQKAFLALTLVVFLLPLSAYADTLFVSPTSGNYTVGQTFSMRVLVSSPSRSVNAVSGTISFPRDNMQVTSVSKSGSILSLWVAEPSFSNTVGSVSFEGVVPNPGYTGSSGTIVTINFRVTAPGDVVVRVSSGSILANDGLGTNILRTLGTSSFAFSEALPEPEPEPEPEVVPVAPDVAEVPVVSQPDPVEAPRVLVKEGLYDKLLNFLSDLSLTNALILFLVAVIISLIALLLYGRRQFVHLRTKVMRRDVNNVEKALVKSFGMLREDIADCVDLFERTNVRRRLTEEERAVVNLLRQHLRNIEKITTKDLRDIRRHTEN